MKAADFSPCLQRFFPFSQCGEDFCAKALKLGKVAHYTGGEPIFHSGAPAKYCGLILNGQAITFNKDKMHRQYSVCHGKGCYIGLEALHPDAVYEEKAAALSDVDILFWNTAGLQQLQQQSVDFCEMIRIPDEGRCYQKQNLVPKNDVSDPVLCSLTPHPAFYLKKIFPHMQLAVLSLAGCSILLKRFPSAWLLLIFLILTGLYLFIQKIVNQQKTRFILTPKNIIPVSSPENDFVILPLADIKSIEIEQNRIEQIFNAGKLLIYTPWEFHQTFSLRRAKDIAQFIHQFSPQSEILTKESNPNKQPEAQPDPEGCDPEGPFKPIVFHAHWAFLVHSIIKPSLLFILLLGICFAIGPSAKLLVLRKILIVLMFLCFCSMVYEFFTWEGNRFIIEENRVWDCYKKPFAKEDQNVAMNQKIQSVRFKKSGFFQILFNYGTVFILAGEGELTFNYIGNPEKVQHLIMDTCSRYEEKLRHQEESRRNAYIAELVHEIGASK